MGGFGNITGAGSMKPTQDPSEHGAVAALAVQLMGSSRPSTGDCSGVQTGANPRPRLCSGVQSDAARSLCGAWEREVSGADREQHGQDLGSTRNVAPADSTERTQ